jgi:hypothetical protein
MKIDFVQGDLRWKELRKRSVNDLYWFSDVVLDYGDKIPMRPNVHLLLCKFIEKKTGSQLLDTARYRKIEMPRETGKSSLIRAYIIQRICANRDISILLINEKELLAKDFLGDIKFQFENNQLLRALFPELIPPDLNNTIWSATRIVVQRTTGRPDPTLDTAGVGAALAGKHPDLIICDDMISRDAMENARAGAWQIMHQTNRWIHQLEPIVNKSAEPFPETIFVGTRWWFGDSYEHVESAYGNGESPQKVLLRAKLESGTQQVDAYRVGDLAVFRRAAIEDGQSIFPEKWSLEDLAKLRVRDPVLFSANYMNNPSDDITSAFKLTWLKYLTWLEQDHSFHITTETAEKKVIRVSDLDRVILVDPGGFSERLTEDRARAAVVVLGDDLQGKSFFLDCYSEQDTYLVAIKQVVNFCHRYSPRKVFVERAGQQVAFAQLLRRAIQDAGLSVIVDDTSMKTGNVNKDVRILEMEPTYQGGSFYIGSGPAFHEFTQQYGQYPRAMRKDIIDLLGYWPRLRRRIQPSGTQRTEVRQAEERALARSRMASLTHRR